MMNYNNPYAGGQPKSPQQLQAELMAALNGQYAPMYNAYQQQNVQSPIPNQPCTSGMYDKVTTYQDVENYPTPTNGTAVLLFNYEQGVFYSKKFVNGQSVIQPFTFMPLNSSSSTETQVNEEKPQTFEDKVLTAMQGLSDRIAQLENAKTKSKSGKRENVEVSDEL